MNLNGSIQVAFKTLADWTLLNPVLLEGQPAVVVLPGDKINVKYGDGIRHFLDLPYAGSVSDDLGAWTVIPTKSGYVINEDLQLKYKVDLLTTENKSTLYIAGQFDLDPSFVGSEIILGVLPVFARPAKRLKRWFASNCVEMFWIVETTGELKIVSKDGLHLPVSNTDPAMPFHLNMFFKVPTLFTATRTGSFNRLSCGENEVGTIVRYTKTYLAFSKEEANAQALADPLFSEDGQAYANDSQHGGICNYYPQPITYSYTRTGQFTMGCAENEIGSGVTFNKIYSSTESQAKAKELADSDQNFNTLGQAYANDPSNGGTCTHVPEIITYSSSRTGEFTRNNCGTGQLGTSVTFQKTYFSTESQIDANSKAENDTIGFDSLGQAYANDPENGGNCQLQKIYVWGKINEQNQQDTKYGVYATILLNTYKGPSGVNPPEPVSGNLYPCTAANIPLQYRFEGAYPSSPTNYTTNLVASSSKQLTAPGTEANNKYFPKQAITNTDGSIYYHAFTGKARNEMILLQTIN